MPFSLLLSHPLAKAVRLSVSEGAHAHSLALSLTEERRAGMQEGNRLGCQDDGESNEGESRRAVVISGMSCRLAFTSESDASLSPLKASRVTELRHHGAGCVAKRHSRGERENATDQRVKSSSHFPLPLANSRATLTNHYHSVSLSLSLALSPADQLCSGNHPLSLEDLHFKNSFACIITNLLS